MSCDRTNVVCNMKRFMYFYNSCIFPNLFCSCTIQPLKNYYLSIQLSGATVWRRVSGPLLLRKFGSAGNRTWNSGSVARNSDHKATEAASVVGRYQYFGDAYCFHLHLLKAKAVRYSETLIPIYPTILWSSETSAWLYKLQRILIFTSIIELVLSVYEANKHTA
jgi:hypothetical protein